MNTLKNKLTGVKDIVVHYSMHCFNAFEPLLDLQEATITVEKAYVSH